MTTAYKESSATKEAYRCEEEEEYEDEYEYEYETDSDTGGDMTASVTFTEEELSESWTQPSEEAVRMSLLAEETKDVGKKRLAKDLYQLMMASEKNPDSGFQLQPSNEDSMDKWTIHLSKFDTESNLAKDMKVLRVPHVELEMTFPDQYPHAPPFVRVVRPMFLRRTGFVMDGALCMELLTPDGWNPCNDIESVIVSIRSLVVVGDGRLQRASELSKERYQELLESYTEDAVANKQWGQAEAYSLTKAQEAHKYLTTFHEEKGWSEWWNRHG